MYLALLLWRKRVLLKTEGRGANTLRRFGIYCAVFLIAAARYDIGLNGVRDLVERIRL